jgi:hypothetical protein
VHTKCDNVMNETIKTTISDAQLKNELIALFESGNTDKGKCLEVLGSKYKIQVQRFYTKCNDALLEWQNTREKFINEQIQANATDSLKSGLKSKLDRLLELQSQQKKLEDELHNNITVTTAFHNGELITAFRELSPLERTKIHQVIKDIRAEISKIEGDYAPTKVAQTDVEGNDAKLKVIGVQFID